MLQTHGVFVARNELPRSVQKLIEQHIHSAADVDTLLLLSRNDRPWTASAVARELRIDEDQVSGILARLLRRGLLDGEEGSYRFHPRDAATAEAVAQLAQLYPTYRLAIMESIYARATGPIRDFSNAFRLRREE
jgi:DNA-binding MarR family transcriptional regulator